MYVRNEMANIGMKFLYYGLKHYKYKFYRWNPRPWSLKFSHVCTDYKKNWERKSLKLRKLNDLNGMGILS